MREEQSIRQHLVPGAHPRHLPSVASDPGKDDPEPAAPPRPKLTLTFKAKKKTPGASAFSKPSPMRITSLDWSRPAAQTGIVYGYCGDVAGYVPECVKPYTSLEVSDDDAVRASRHMRDALSDITTRILGDRAEPDIDKALVKNMGSGIFHDRLGADVAIINGGHVLTGPYCSAKVDWGPCWASPAVKVPLAVGEVKGSYTSVHRARCLCASRGSSVQLGLRSQGLGPAP